MADDKDRQVWRRVTNIIYGDDPVMSYFDGTVKPGVCDRAKTDEFALYWVSNVWDGKSGPEMFDYKSTAKSLIADFNEWNGWSL